MIFKKIVYYIYYIYYYIYTIYRCYCKLPEILNLNKSATRMNTFLKCTCFSSLIVLKNGRHLAPFLIDVQLIFFINSGFIDLFTSGPTCPRQLFVTRCMCICSSLTRVKTKNAIITSSIKL